MIGKRIASLLAAVSMAAALIPISVSASPQIPNAVSAKDERLITYTAPDGVEISGTYTVKARPLGAGDDAWQDVDVYRVQVMSNGTRKAGMAYFDCTGPTEVQVTCTGQGDGIDNIENGLNSETAVYPKSYNIDLDYEIGGKVIDLVVKPGQRVVLDPNGDTRRNLQIYADTPIRIPGVDELEAQGRTVTVIDAAKGDTLQDRYDTDVVYVKPGFYVNGDNWGSTFVRSDQTWYFEGGAVINGRMVLDNTENAKLIGHGLIYRPGHAAMNVCGARNAYIEGIMGLNHGWGDNGGYFINISDSKNIYVKDLKSIGRHKWGDSMDIFCSEDITVEGCFFRGNDDCIAVYGPRWNGDHWGDTGNVRNIKVRDCVLMPDLARPIHFGTHGDSASPNGGRVIDNCRFENIDILTYNKYAFRDGASMPQAIRMDVSEGNTVSNIYFNDIRIQDFAANKLVELFITTQQRYGTYTFPGKGINNVYFKDIAYENPDPTFNGRIEGGAVSDGTDGITQNITFENLKINGEVARNADDAHLSIGSNTRNISFTESGESQYIYNPSVVPEDIWPEFYDYARANGATASADASANGSEPSAVLDNDDSTVWYSPVSGSSSVYNEADKTVTGDGITIDMKAQRHISGVRITWADPALTHSYRIYVSKDGTDWSAGHTDEHAVGAVNAKAADEFNKRVKTTWFINQYDPVMNQDYIIGRYVKIIPQAGSMLDMAKLEILGTEIPQKSLSAVNTSLLAAAPAENETDDYEITAAEAPGADTGAAGGISNGGDWSIYASKIGSARNTTAISDASNKGVAEVSKNGGYSEQLQFDLSTMLNNSAAAEGMVVKSAKLRLTPMVTRAGIKHNLYVIDNGFTTTEGGIAAAEFDVPRGGNNDINKDSAVTAIEAEGMTEYPGALAAWQTDIDITGNAVTASDNKLSFNIDYASGNKEKTEYATTNIAANGRLNGGAVPLLYSGAATEYSKWVYPQIVFTYTDSRAYKDAYADFVKAYSELNSGRVTETNGISLSDTANGSTVELEICGDGAQPIKADGQSLVFNEDYVGNEEAADVRLTVTKTDGGETAVYSRVLSVNAEYTKSNSITFDASKSPKGELSVVSAGKVYKDGTAYAKPNGVFYVDGGANAGYTAKTVVKKSGTEEMILPNEDGSYTMPDGNAELSVEYSKNTFGTSRIAAVNSASLKRNGDKEGIGSAPNIVMGAERITFVKFDLSDYDVNLMTDAQIRFNAWNTANAKAVFYVPNNDWDESSISKDFRLDGTDGTSLSGFTYADGTISLLNGEGAGALIIPDADNASSAAEGILKDYYIGSTGTAKAADFNVTDAVKTALSKSGDNVITLMIYSRGGGNDASSVIFADSIMNRPSLTITESASCLPDDELITEIKTTAELERFAEIVNGGNSYKGKTVTLANDIDLSETYNVSGRSWTPIGTQDLGGIHSFAGTFEGGNHSITGLYINTSGSTQGLFGIVTGTVKNLTVSGEITASSVAGGIAARCEGNTAVITDCHSNVNITAQREAGGIVGTLSSGGVISNSDNAGNVTVLNKETYAGGIAGHNIMALVDSCTNTGNIENGSDGFRNRLGGIVGFLDNGEIRGSRNEGNVTSNAEIASYTADESQNYVGGIIGYGSYGVISDSSSSGDVHNAVDHTGGTAGCLQTGCVVSGCTNSGAVSGRNYVGGIAGYNISDVTSCHNSGTVTGRLYAGGVIGYLSRGAVHNCTFENNDNLDITGFNAYGTVTDDEAPKPTENSVKYVDKNAEVTVKAGGEYTLIFAAYDAQNVLQSIDVQQITFDDAGEKTVSPKKTDINADAASVKVMLWSSLDKMQPACPAAE